MSFGLLILIISFAPWAHAGLTRPSRRPRDISKRAENGTFYTSGARNYSMLGVPPDPFTFPDSKFDTKIFNYREPSIPMSGAKDVMFDCLSTLLEDVRYRIPLQMVPQTYVPL